jgi:hypothetical protein
VDAALRQLPSRRGAVHGTAILAKSAVADRVLPQQPTLKPQNTMNLVGAWQRILHFRQQPHAAQIQIEAYLKEKVRHVTVRQKNLRPKSQTMDTSTSLSGRLLVFFIVYSLNALAIQEHFHGYNKNNTCTLLTSLLKSENCYACLKMGGR